MGSIEQDDDAEDINPAIHWACRLSAIIGLSQSVREDAWSEDSNLEEFQYGQRQGAYYLRLCHYSYVGSFTMIDYA